MHLLTNVTDQIMRFTLGTLTVILTLCLVVSFLLTNNFHQWQLVNGRMTLALTLWLEVSYTLIHKWGQANK